MKTNKDTEIAKAILEWINNMGFQKSYETLIEETGISKEDVSRTKVLEKKWTTILTMQKKINDLESKMKSMKEEYEQASVQGLSYNTKKENTSMVSKVILHYLGTSEDS